MNTLYKLLLVSTLLVFAGCEKFLDRPPLDQENDDTAWNSELNLRLYANKFYTDFFIGYGVNFDDQGGAALLSYTNSDDVLTLGVQPNITRAVPNSGIWSMTSLRSMNIMIDRIENSMGDILSAEAKGHWLGIARFFRAFRYFQLVSAYGDVPYYGREVFDTELDELYKPRTPRNEVMDAVYDDLVYAYENVRINDGVLNVNRDVVAGFISRIALHEGTWQKYYYNNPERARRFFELALQAGSYVITSNRYAIELDYKSLFASDDLSGKKDCILYRKYDAGAGTTHSVASNSNLVESRANGPTTDLIKSYICVDGQAWQNSSVADAEEFNLSDLIRTRDSRFEATFYSEPEPLNRASLYYVTKFFPRDMERRLKVDGENLPASFTSSFNETDYPVLRYAEVLLNWVEAKAELATLGGAAITQDDLNNTINRIRDRPLASEAVTRGVTKTAALSLANLPNDPSRDPDVSPLIWEIRRERRMEFTFEYSRLADLRRWSKMEYMDTDANPDLLSGGWVDFPNDLPSQLTSANVDILSVVNMNGTEHVYSGSNAGLMVGFYRHASTRGRLPFINQVNINAYLQPVGLVQMQDYQTRGYHLQQTEGWPQN